MWARRRWDIALAVLAVLFAVPTLWYPYGHDQGLYFYVGRAWLEGSVPYRDVFDHKTPGVYLVHLVSILLFGANEASIRVLDIVAVVATGWVAARLTAARGRRVARGMYGVAIVCASAFGNGLFTYWETAQTEIWYGLFGLAAIERSVRARSLASAALSAGVLAGAAFVMKPPAACFALGAAALLLARGWKEDGAIGIGRALGLFGVACAVVPGLFLAYFGACGALPAMFDIVVGANRYYVLHEGAVTAPGEVAARLREAGMRYFPANVVLAGAVVTFFLSGDAARRARYVPCFVSGAAALAAVYMQHKFFIVHWVVLVAPMTHAAALLADQIGRGPVLRRRADVVVASTTALVVFGVTTATRDVVGDYYTRTWKRMTGTLTAQAYADAFWIEGLYYFYGDIRRTGLWLRDHTRPDETVCVRGFNPGVYVFAGRHYGGRFFWSNFLVSPTRAYRRADYLAEDAAALERTQPRYVVTLTEVHDTPDGTDHWLARGWRVVETFGMLQVVERAPPSSR